MYYFYNQSLRAILTAERWASADDLQNRPHSFLCFPSLEGGKEVLNRLKTAFGKETIRYVILLKEDRVKKPSKWPSPLKQGGGNSTDMVAKHGSLITFLLQSTQKFVQLRESSTLFPISTVGSSVTPVVVETVHFFDQVLTDVTVEVVATATEEPEKATLDFQQVHSQFSAKKKSSMLATENGDITLKSSLNFQDYLLTQDLREISDLITHVYQNIEEICLNYGEILRSLDAQIEDELHFIEFFDVDASRCVKSYKRLQELRVKRRCVKDSMQLADLFMKQLGTDLPKKLHHVSEKIDHWDKRHYSVRVPDEFKH